MSLCQKETGTNYAQNSVSTVDIAGVSTLVYTTPQPQPFSRSSPKWQPTLFCQLILHPIVWHGAWKLFWCVLNCVGLQFVCLVCLYALWNPVKSNGFPRISTLWAPVPILFNLECIHQTFESLQLCLWATRCPLQTFPLYFQIEYRYFPSAQLPCLNRDPLDESLDEPTPPRAGKRTCSLDFALTYLALRLTTTRPSSFSNQCGTEEIMKKSN